MLGTSIGGKLRWRLGCKKPQFIIYQKCSALYENDIKHERVITRFIKLMHIAHLRGT
jgi:hypothetical protein